MKTKHHIILSAPGNPIHRKWFALGLGGFLFTSIFALSAPPAEAQCQQWDINGQYNIFQGHTSFPVALNQNGKTVSGTTYKESQGDDDNGKQVHGRVTGTLEGDSFNVQINWADGGVGIYRGRINQAGRLEGTSYDKNKPSSKFTWHAEHTFQCAPATAVQPTNPPPKIIKRTGKAKPATTPSQLPVYPGSGSSGSGTKGGFLQLHTPTPAPTANAEADESSSTDTEDQQGKHKKNKKKHHHHDDDQNQGND